RSRNVSLWAPATGSKIPGRWPADCGAQTFLRALGIDIAFSREGRAGNRVIRIHASPEDTVRTVSDNGKPSCSRQLPLRMADDVGAGSHRADLTGLASVMTTGDAATDAKL